MSIRDYRIISVDETLWHTAIPALEEMVREHIQQGWTPLGGPFIRHGATRGAVWCQAIVLEGGNG